MMLDYRNQTSNIVEHFPNDANLRYGVERKRGEHKAGIEERGSSNIEEEMRAVT